jgi:hypothetical protein
MTTEKRPRGRPLGTKKERTGKHIWIPADVIDMVQAIVATSKQQQQAKRP